MTNTFKVFAVVCFVAAALAWHQTDEDVQLERFLSAEKLSRQKRVIGGDPIDEGDWPYLVRLKGKVPRSFFWGIPYNYQYFYCGASLLNNRWLLTAAHCFSQPGFPSRTMTPKYWHAKIGEIHAHDHWYNWFLNIFDAGDLDLHLTEIKIHPNYNAYQLWMNDIALVKVEDNVDFNLLIGPVELPGADVEDWPQDGAQCIMKGWGCTENGAGLSDIANAVMLPKYPDDDCQRLYGASTETRLCAGRTTGNSGICSGDSGGPLVCPMDVNGEIVMVQAGVASFTSASDPESLPGAFTRVTEYLDWIHNNI